MMWKEVMRCLSGGVEVPVAMVLKAHSGMALSGASMMVKVNWAGGDGCSRSQFGQW